MTPMMKQYWQIKSLHKDKIVFFRMGDFYEMFDKDAEVAAPILNIVLTARNKKSAQGIKMCGVPHHSIAGPISKLLMAGFKVAICDQVGSVTLSKAPMHRKVTRILTPGMVYDPESLDSLTAHYLCAIDPESISFADISTGEAFFYNVSDPQKQNRLIYLLHPAELILTSQQKEKSFHQEEWSLFPISVFDVPSLGQKLDQNLNSTTLKTVDSVHSYLPVSARRILEYIRSSQGDTIVRTIRSFQKKSLGKTMLFSPQALESMEIFKTYKGDVKGSLFHAINRTKTPAGGRLLKSRLRQPCTDLPELENRLNQIDHWIKRPADMERIRSLLTSVGDIERRLGKLSHSQCCGKDLLLLAKSLQIGSQVMSLCMGKNFHSSIHHSTEYTLETIQPTAEQNSSAHNVSMHIAELAQMLSNKINSTICSDVAVGGRFKPIIRKGISTELDRLIEETDQKQRSLNQLEVRERCQTGIPSLKIRYNNVFGYYIEVTKVHSRKVPAHYIRKQTLTQAERYTISDLQVLEGQILSNSARRIEIEKQIFESLRQNLLQHLPDLFYMSRILCEMDVSLSLAWLAIERSYIRPQFSSDNQLELFDSRHPVVEQKQGLVFVPNTVCLKTGECLMLTGPNMAGKSTLMRQVALSVILAQTGCFVPAEKALLPIFTQLFTRIGASDNLSQGLSTFMVEMKESAEILKRADTRSLIILDEVGRGTATYDGMSLAQAMLEYLVTEKKSLIFFATHYLELTVLSQVIPQIKNAHLQVTEKDGQQINFLYTLSAGSAAGSYGVYVADLAGFPKTVITRAKNCSRRENVFLNPN